MSQVSETNESTFEQDVLQAEIPVVVDFYASWCGPCKMMARIIDDLAVELDGKARFVKVNVEQAPRLAQIFKVRAVPTLAFVHNGEVRDIVAGFLPASELKRRIDEMQAAPAAGGMA